MNVKRVIIIIIVLVNLKISLSECDSTIGTNCCSVTLISNLKRNREIKKTRRIETRERARKPKHDKILMFPGKLFTFKIVWNTVWILPETHYAFFKFPARKIPSESDSIKKLKKRKFSFVHRIHFFKKIYIPRRLLKVHIKQLTRHTQLLILANETKKIV